MGRVADQSASEAPLVSVSMLTYNAVDYVEEALRSVLAQEVDFPVEIVVGDDCSRDGTQEILADYARRYPDVIRLHLHCVRGSGVPGRVNNMHNLASCRGRYIAILDGDDYWLTTEKLQRQIAFLESHHDYSAVGSDGIVRTPNGSRAALLPELRGADVGFDTLARFAVTGLTPSGLIFRRAAALPLPEWFEDIIVADHYLFGFLMRAGKIRLLPERYFCYRLHDTSFSATYLPDQSVDPFRIYDDYERHAQLFPELPTSWLLDWRRVVTLLRTTTAAARARRWGVVRGGLERLRAIGLRRLFIALAGGTTGMLKRALTASNGVQRAYEPTVAHAAPSF